MQRCTSVLVTERSWGHAPFSPGVCVATFLDRCTNSRWIHSVVACFDVAADAVQLSVFGSKSVVTNGYYTVLDRFGRQFLLADLSARRFWLLVLGIDSHSRSAVNKQILERSRITCCKYFAQTGTVQLQLPF